MINFMRGLAMYENQENMYYIELIHTPHHKFARRPLSQS
jgi:hypothetical protein